LEDWTREIHEKFADDSFEGAEASDRPQASRAASVTTGFDGMDGRALWIRWLTDAGWGTAVVTSPVPPCSPAELAAEYYRVDPSRPGDWMREIYETFTDDIFEGAEEGERPPPRRQGGRGGARL
jgi:hypothetical protein